MITQTYNFTVSGSTATLGANDVYLYTYSFTKNSDCLTIDNASGNTNGEISVDFTFEDEACIETVEVVLVVQDLNGCVKSIPVVLVNPCTLSISTIQNNGFQFSVSVTGGTPNYTYAWSYDQDIFNLVDSNSTDSLLELSYNPKVNPVPLSTNISVVVTDSFGCTITQSKSITFDVPVARNQNFILNCSTTNPCNTTHYAVLNLSVYSTEGVDWTSLVVNGPTCVQNLGNGQIRIGINSATTGVVGLQYNYTVKNVLGIISNTGILYATVLPCSRSGREGYITSYSSQIQIIATDVVTDIKTIDVEGKINSNPAVDWSTFQFLNTPTYGTVTLNGDREIEYEITSLADVGTIDTIKWSVENTNGDLLTITEVVNRDIIAAPVTIGVAICATCNTPTVETDILAGATGDVDRSTVEILTADPDVSFVKLANNNFIFTPIPTAGLTSVLTYRVSNSQGVVSNTSNVALSNVCSGSSTDINITCFASKTFDLIDYYTDVYTISYSFTETTVTNSYTSQGGSIVNATSVGTVDFTGIDPGVYTFRLTAAGVGACAAFTDITDINITVEETPELTITSSTDNGNNTGTIEFDIVNCNNSTFSVTNNGSPATFTISPSISGTSGVFTANLVSGANVFVITALSNCNTVLTDTDTITI